MRQENVTEGRRSEGKCFSPFLPGKVSLIASIETNQSRVLNFNHTGRSLSSNLQGIHV